MNIDRFVFIAELTINCDQVNFKKNVSDSIVLKFANANGTDGEIMFESVIKLTEKLLRCRVLILTNFKKMLESESVYLETIKSAISFSVISGEFQFEDIVFIKCRIPEMLIEDLTISNKKYTVYSDMDGYSYVKLKNGKNDNYVGYLPDDLKIILENGNK